MAKVVLGVTGSVAAIYTRELVEALRGAGHEVKVVATAAARYFFDPAALMPGAGERDRNRVILDEDEWPGTRYERGDAVLHIELRRWADVLLIAPCDANTLAKLALGICDNCLTCVYRAWDRTRPVVLAPAMNTLMWEHPATARHLNQIRADLAAGPPGSSSLHIVSPAVKRLACDDIGAGALADRAAILATVEAAAGPARGAPPAQ